ncbi:MAG TPA: CBS domain-containing protein [Nitrososphaerales archaeon]|nr:CBS domain-containing protein [Nitrososphaerales archaeon]
MPKWKCYRCGTVYDQEAPPDICANCNAAVSFWIDWTEAKTPLEDPVGKYMNRQIVMIDINNSAWEAAKLMREKNAGCVFVTNGGQPVGIVTERDILYKIVADGLPAAHVLLRKIMSTPLVSVEEVAPIRKAMSLMKEGGFRRLLVLGERGKAVGMISQQDLLDAALQSTVAS